MNDHPIAAVILAAGKGTRMKSNRPKVLHEVAGLPIVGHVIAAVSALEPERIAVVVGPDMEELTSAVAPHPTPVQTDRRGTADAFKAARGALVGFTEGTILVLLGDTVFLKPDILRAMVERRVEGNAVVVLGVEPEDPGDYGRMIVDEAGELLEIVEVFGRPDVRSVGLCNTGVMAFDASVALDLVDRIRSDNPKGEFYLTDIVAEARAAGLRCAHVLTDEFKGIDSRVGLAEAEAAWQATARLVAMEGGATLLDPETTYFSWDTILGRDVVVGQNTVFGPGVSIGDGVTIKPFCHLEGCSVADGATIGPFARLRPGTELGEGTRVGNFVETKNAIVEAGAKLNHLSYVGDAHVGAKANIGAGTITCNYDGHAKHKTVIGAGAFIGSNSALVAPLTIGARAIVGAGSTVTKSVGDDALAVARGQQKTIDNGAARLRERRK